MSGVELDVWLEELGLGSYADAFKENDIDWAILPELTNEDLKELGLNLIGHRRKLLKEISALNAKPAEPQLKTDESEHQAERRLVSVLFCDMVGSTSLSARIDPEDLREVQRRYQDAVTSTVSAHGGHVGNYVGDGVVAYFGWPIAHENQALQAVRAGRAALEKVAELTVPGTDIRLAARAGIATGQVVVGDLSGTSSHQPDAISGKAPNTAARLQGLADPGQLTIDGETERLLSSSFELVDLGTHEFKGLSTGVRVYRVEEELSFESRFDAAIAAQDLNPLVGRESDFELIRSRWDQAVSGEGQTVLLTGEPGIGKSRMIQQLYEHLENERKTIIRYQCAHNSGNAALHPLVAMLERLAGFERSDSTDTKFDKLEKIIHKTSRPFEQTAALIATALHLPAAERYPALGMTPQRQLEETLLMFIEQAMALTELAPLLIVFEDLHWADPTTLDLIGRMIVEAKTKPIMLLATFREEFSPPWPTAPNLTMISLSPIGSAECGVMIDQLTSGKTIPAALKEQIIEKADGVPLYLEEITKNVLETGYLVETETSFEPVGDLADLAIPSTIQATLMARLDRQSQIKNVAQIGACIGREFNYDIVLAIAEMSEPPLQEALNQLAHARVVYCRGVPPSSTYSFKHALLRDAAHDSMLRSRRRKIHQQIVNVIEAQESNDIIKLALHCAAAGLAKKAATYFLEVGRASIDSGTFSEAVSQLRLGLDEIARIEDTGAERDRLELDIRVALGTAEMALKGWAADEIIEVLDPAVPLAKELKDDFALGLSLFSIWIYHGTRSDMKTAQHWLKEMDDVVKNNDNQDLQMIADTAASMNYFWIGEFDKAEERRVRTLRDYRPKKHRHLVNYMNHDPYSTVLQWAGATQLWCQGYPDRANVALEEALANARTLDNPFSVVFALTIGSFALLETGQGARMLEQCKEAGEICDEIGLPFIKIVTDGAFSGRALISIGDDEIGASTLAETTAIWEMVGGRTTYGEYTSRIATALGRLGRFEEAMPLSDKALAHAASTGEVWYQAESHRIHGQLLLSSPTPDRENGMRYLTKASEIAHAQGARSFELRAATTRAEYLLKDDQAKTAEALLDPIYRQFTEGFQSPDLVAAKALLESIS